MAAPSTGEGPPTRACRRPASLLLQTVAVGIKKQHASTIAGALLDLAEARPELLGEGGGGGEGGSGEAGGGGGNKGMVTLALEGNISAGEAPSPLHAAVALLGVCVCVSAGARMQARAPAALCRAGAGQRGAPCAAAHAP